MEGQRVCKRGRRERQRCAGQIDRLLLIIQSSLQMETKDKEVKKFKARGTLAVNSTFQCTLSLQLTQGQRLDLKQINKTVSGEC